MRAEYALFPLPVFSEGGEGGASLMTRAAACVGCSRPCLEDKSTELSICFKGLNYQRIDSESVTFGFVVPDLPLSTPAHKRAVKRAGRECIRSAFVSRVVAAARRSSEQEIRDRTLDRQLAVDAYRGSDQFKADLQRDVQDAIEKASRSAHDLKNLVHTVSANAKVLLESKQPGSPAEESAEKHHHEGAIYFAAELMKAKIDTVLFLSNPFEMHRGLAQVSVHGIVLKYVRIYQSMCADRGTRIRVSNPSYGKVRVNGDALGIVIQSLLDNAVKYSPQGEAIDVIFDENEKRIGVSIRSLGPKIEDFEKSSIFAAAFRGAAAKCHTSDGLGFGLSAAKQVSDELELDLGVEQDQLASSRHAGYFATTFAFSLNR